MSERHLTRIYQYLGLPILTAGGLQIGPQNDGAFIALLTMKTKAKPTEILRVSSHGNILEFPTLIMLKN